MGGLLSLSHKYWPYSESSLQNVTQVNNFPTLSKIYLLTNANFLKKKQFSFISENR